MAKIDPFSDDAEDKGPEANEKLKSELADQISSKEPAGDVEVSLEPETPDDDDDEPAPRPGQRQRKKNNRVKQFEEERNAALEEARLAREDAAKHREMAAYHAGLNAQREAHGGPRKDPLEERVDKIYEEIDQIYANQGQLKTPDQIQAARTRLRDLDREKGRLLAQSEARGVVQQHANPTVIRQQMIQAQHVDVSSNPQAMAYADGYWKMRRAQGAADTEELIAEAMDKARVDILRTTPKRNGQSPKPDAAHRQRYSGQPRGGGSGARVEGPKTMTMTREYRQMARTMYPNLPEKQAMQKWVNEVGRDLMNGGGRAAEAEE